MTVPAVAATPIEPPPQLEGVEGNAAEPGAFAAMLSKESEAPVEEDPREGTSSEDSAEVEGLLAEGELEGSEGPDTDLLAQLLASVLGETKAGTENSQASGEAARPSSEAERGLPAALREARVPQQGNVTAEQAAAKNEAPEVAKPGAPSGLPSAPAEDGEALPDPAAAVAKLSTQPEAAARAESQAPRPVEAPNTAPGSGSAPNAGVQAAAQADLARSSADPGSDGEARDEAPAGLARAETSEEAPREVATGSRFSELLQPSTAPADRPEALPAATAPLTPPVVGPVVTSGVPTTAPASSIPAGAPNEVVPLHVEWLAARGGGSARLQLDPPNLGQVELAVTVRGSSVDIVVRAADPAAQLAVAQTREMLADGLAARDLRIENFEVRGSGSETRSDSQPDPNPRDAANLTSGQGRSEGGETKGSGEPGFLGRSEASLPNDVRRTSTPNRPGDSGVDLHI